MKCPHPTSINVTLMFVIYYNTAATSLKLEIIKFHLKRNYMKTETILLNRIKPGNNDNISSLYSESIIVT